MSDKTNLKEWLFERLYLEVEPKHKPIVKDCVMDIYAILEKHGINLHAIKFFQIKEKYGTLRVYYELNLFSMYSLSVSAEEYDRKHRITSEIDNAVEFYDKMFQEKVGKKDEVCYNHYKEEIK
jgi:hypothetical protein